MERGDLEHLCLNFFHRHVSVCFAVDVRLLGYFYRRTGRSDYLARLFDLALFLIGGNGAKFSHEVGVVRLHVVWVKRVDHSGLSGSCWRCCLAYSLICSGDQGVAGKGGKGQLICIPYPALRLHIGTRTRSPQ